MFFMKRAENVRPIPNYVKEIIESRRKGRDVLGDEVDYNRGDEDFFPIPKEIQRWPDFGEGKDS